MKSKQGWLLEIIDILPARDQLSLTDDMVVSVASRYAVSFHETKKSIYIYIILWPRPSLGAHAHARQYAYGSLVV